MRPQGGQPWSREEGRGSLGRKGKRRAEGWRVPWGGEERQEARQERWREDGHLKVLLSS